jgi:predicted Zn-dependent peptidase
MSADVLARPVEDGFTLLRHGNGVTACVDERPGSPLAAISIRIEGGSGDDPIGRSGLAHLFEHLLFAGTPSVGRDLYMAAVYDAGAFCRATTGVSWNTFSTICAPDAVPEILRLETDRFAATVPYLTAAVVDREKQVVRRERAQRVDTAPYGDALERLFPLLYGPSPYSRIPVGIDGEVDSITLDDCVGHFSRGYGGGRVSIVASGAVAAEAVGDDLARLMNVFPRGERPVREFGTVPGPAPLIEVPTTLPPRIYLGFRLPAAHETAFDEARLGAYLLGKGEGSLLRRLLVGASPAVLSDVKVKTLTRAGIPSAGIIEATPADGVPVTGARAAIRRVLDEVSGTPIATADAERARADFRRSWYRDDDSIRGRADGLSLALLRSADPGRYARELDVAAPDPEAISRAAGWWASERIAGEVVYA